MYPGAGILVLVLLFNVSFFGVVCGGGWCLGVLFLFTFFVLFSL